MERASSWREVLRIAVPMMLADSIDSILWITDTFFVSRIGDSALEAVGLGGYLSWLVYSIGSLLYMGSMVLIAQAVGAGKRREAEEILGEGLALSILLSIPVLLGLWLSSGYLVNTLAGPRVSYEARLQARDYFLARLVSTPFMYAGITLDSVYRATGVTRPLVVTTGLYAVTNAVLDPVLIFGLAGLPRMGVKGAGVASSIANIIFMLSSYALLPRTRINAKVSRPSKYALRIVSIGLPVMAERIAMVSGHLIYLGYVARCGDSALAAHTIGVRIESIAFLPLYALSEATASLAGQAIGYQGPATARRVTLDGATLSFAAGTIIGGVLVTLSGILPRIFSSDQTVIALAKAYLIIAAVSEPLFGLAMSLSMGIRGGGNTRLPLLVNLAVYYGARAGAGSVLLRMTAPPYCAVLVWETMVLDYGIRSTIFILIADKYYNRITKKFI